MKSQSVYGVGFDENDRVLLIKDSSSHLWGLPGGGIESGENHEQALVRELSEETGLKLISTPIYLHKESTPSKDLFFYIVQYDISTSLVPKNSTDIESAAFTEASRLTSLDTVPSLGHIIALAHAKSLDT